MSGGCSCPTVVCPPSPPRCGGGSSAGCGGGSCGGGCGGTSGGCGSSGNCGGGSSGGCVATNCDNGYGGCSSGCVGSSGCSGCSGSSSGCGGSSSYGGSSVGCGGSSGCSGSSSGCGGSHGTYPSPSTGCAPSSARLTIECSKETTTGGCGNTINCLPQEQKPSSGYAKGNSGGGGYTNTGQQPTSGCSSENCSPVHPQQQQTSQQNNPSYNAPPPLPPQNYVAPSLPTAECQSATPNECNILPQSSNQPTWSSGAGGTYAQKNTEGDRELLQNKGEGFSSSGNSGFGQGNYESIQTSTFPSPPLTTYNQQQQIPEHQPVQPPPIVEPALPPLPPTDDYLTSLSPETETTTGGEEENKENYKRDPPSINVSGGKINGGPNMQGNKLASAKIPATVKNL
uniref:Uncharacterized protein n=1 Tax=Meloidogyne hapla TaxID=6305 RepID=A0A1I8BTD4_MELHA